MLEKRPPPLGKLLFLEYAIPQIQIHPRYIESTLGRLNHLPKLKLDIPIIKML